MKYRPNHYSELLLGRDPSCDCYLGCRIGADAIATDIATFGESSRNEYGRTIGKQGRRKLLQQGWDAFITGPADANGIPDQGDVLRIHRAMFDLPDPELVQTEDFAGLWAHHGKFAISWALLLSAVPADSTLRRYSGPVGHQMVTYRDAKGGIRVMCPMRPHSTTYRGHPAPRDDIRKAAKAIEDGIIIAELYPVGAWREMIQVRRKKNAEIRELEAELARRGATIAAQALTIDDLQSELDECRRDASKDAGWEAALVRIQEEADVLRTEGPP